MQVEKGKHRRTHTHTNTVAVTKEMAFGGNCCFAWWSGAERSPSCLYMAAGAGVGRGERDERCQCLSGNVYLA